MPDRSATSKKTAARSPVRAAGTAILVLGMHRSGTSAVARMLNLCGADLGHDLLAPKEDNERGFWENSALLSLHEEFLAKSGLQWHDLASLPGNWRKSDAARHFVAALPKVLSQQFGDSRLFLVKDPRLSLLTPLWIEALHARAVRPVFIIMIRHPDEVAASLAKRDGFSFARSHVLWLQHLLEAERSTRGHPRVFVHYENLLADWRGERERIAASLGLEWPNRGAEVDQQVDGFIAPSLRHHRSDARGPGESPAAQIVQDAYAIASAAASASSPPAETAFDAVESAFDATLQIAGPLIADASDRLARDRELHAQEIERARATIDGLAAEIAQAREAHADRDRVEAELREAIADSADEVERARETIDALAIEVERARETIDALAIELEQAREGFAAKDREIGAARDNINELKVEVERARDNINELTAEVARARDNIKDLIAEVERARETVALKDREIDSARRNIDAMIDEVAQARATVASKDREIDDARRNIAALAGEVEQARVVIAAKDVELSSARYNVDALVTQIDRVRSEFVARDAELDAARANVSALDAQIDQARRGFAAKDAELDAARTNIGALVAQIDEARRGFAAKDAEVDAARTSVNALAAELDAARSNINALSAEIDQARLAHAERDGLEAALRGELSAVRESRWFQLGRQLRLMGRDR